MLDTSSSMFALGTKAPDFKLLDVVSGDEVSLEAFRGKKELLVMFICRHCPYVKHVQEALAQLGRDYKDRDLGIVAISANDPEEYPEDAPESLKEQAEELGFTFPYCFDETQETAKAYGAACTPDLFLFDEKMELVYRGQFDDSRPGSDTPVMGKDLIGAVEAVLAGKPISHEQKPSVGCSIKWKR